MLLRHCLIAVAVCAAVALPSPAADKPALADGSYLLYYTPILTQESRVAILEVKTTDGKTVGETVDGGPSKWSITDFKVDGANVTANVAVGPTKLTFEGRIDPKNPKQVLGSMGDNTRLYRAVLVATEMQKLEQKDLFAVAKLPPEMTDLNKVRNAATLLRAQAQRETDSDKKQDLLKQATEAKTKADAEVPNLLRKVVEAHSGTFVGYTSSLELLGVAKAAGVKAEEAKKWAADAVAFAAHHGPRYEQLVVGELAEILARQDGFGEVALGYAEKAVASAEKGPAIKKIRAMKSLAAAQQKSGKAELAKATLAAVDKLEEVADAEYKKTMPPFKPEKYAGRQDKDANRVAVFEMFTGAQCPPCVAADLAFDALETAYSPKELVLIQYHMHIPGPDPMTNKDTLARWDYYSKKFPQEIRGVPSSVFNGKPQAGGGGGIPNAKAKYDQYVKIIDSTLEQKSDLKISGSATLADGGVTVSITVEGMDKPSDEVKVRVLLVEEEVRYQGSNGIRLHHQVVRSAFGKTAGWSLKDAQGGRVSATVKLDDLKKDLSAYLEDYNKNTRAFNPPDRPMEMKHLKVIVIVQDDESGEILQGAQFDVTAGKS
jgi:hypothetical protein